MGDFFNNLNAKFQSFMLGRNGSDKLARWALGAAFIAILINLFIPNLILFALSYALLFYSIYRMFSRNVAARQAENAKFEALIGRFGSKGNRQTRSDAKATGPKRNSSSKGADADKIKFACEQCGQSLSVPKGRGTLKVTCPKCHHQMKVKS